MSNKANNHGELLLVPVDFRTVAFLMQQLAFTDETKLEITFTLDRTALNSWIENATEYLARLELTDDVDLSVRKLST